MIIELNDTSTKEIAAELLRCRQDAGGSSGMVLTLIIVAEDRHRDDVLAAAQASARAHPSRVIVVVYSPGDKPQLDAEIQVGEGVPGDFIALHIRGDELRRHADSVLLPLLLPDSPTVVWWPHEAPANPAADPVGTLATRRITDAAGSPDPIAALLVRARNHTPGDTDLTWTRLTRWRALLAAALDQYPHPIAAGRIASAPDNAPALLLTAWLENELQVPVTRVDHHLPGVSEVRLKTADGDIVINRGGSDSIALYNVPGQPERKVALKRRPLTELLTEELQRLDADETFEAAVGRILEEVGR